METTIDAAGRVVVPKSLREAMRLRPGQTVDIVLADGRLEIAIPVTPVTMVEAGDGHLIAVTDALMPTLPADVVRDVLEQIRR
jgi:AbrB family looped-hinge helix DNA binding protein